MTTLSARPFRLRLRVYVYKVENSLITATTIDRAQLAQQQCEALRLDGRHLDRQGLDVGLVVVAPMVHWRSAAALPGLRVE